MCIGSDVEADIQILSHLIFSSFKDFFSSFRNCCLLWSAQYNHIKDIHNSNKMKCPVKFCHNTHPKKGETSEIRWYCFPTRYDYVRELWLKACGKSEIGKHMKVCSSHFCEDDYDKNAKKRRILSAQAVPKGSVLLSIH